jgi:hypothetical protein
MHPQDVEYIVFMSKSNSFSTSAGPAVGIENAARELHRYWLEPKNVRVFRYCATKVLWGLATVHMFCRLGLSPCPVGVAPVKKLAS